MLHVSGSMVNFVILASRADVGVSTVSVRFHKHQQRATTSIKIIQDAVIEKTESFQLKMTLPKKEMRKKLLKYGEYQQVTVFIQDSK